MLLHSESLLEHQKDSGQGLPESPFSGKPSRCGSPILLHPLVTGGAYRALCTRCAKSWLFSTTGSLVSSEDRKDVIEWLLQWTGL